jgi:hypothetical protein
MRTVPDLPRGNDNSTARRRTASPSGARKDRGGCIDSPVQRTARHRVGVGNGPPHPTFARRVGQPTLEGRNERPVRPSDAGGCNAGRGRSRRAAQASRRAWIFSAVVPAASSAWAVAGAIRRCRRDETRAATGSAAWESVLIWTATATGPAPSGNPAPQAPAAAPSCRTPLRRRRRRGVADMASSPRHERANSGRQAGDGSNRRMRHIHGPSAAPGSSFPGLRSQRNSSAPPPAPTLADQ